MLLLLLLFTPLSVFYQVHFSLLVYQTCNKVLLLEDTEGSAKEELNSVITLDYNQINPESPSSTSEQPMRIASIQFNTIKFIGMLFWPLAHMKSAKNQSQD